MEGEELEKEQEEQKGLRGKVRVRYDLRKGERPVYSIVRQSVRKVGMSTVVWDTVCVGLVQRTPMISWI